ncbi:CAZy families GT2 protein (Fragment), variant 3 [Balamuthia mandrillaris]
MKRYSTQESGLVLSRVFEFFSNAQFTKSKRKGFDPLLCFNTSNQLHTNVFPQLKDELKQAWREFHPPSEHDEMALKETKRLLMELILAGPSSKHVAIANHKHIRYLLALADKRLLVKVFCVERSNLHALQRNMDNLDGSNLVICILYVTGKLSAVDIGRLVDRVKGKSLRLVIKFYSQLYHALCVTGRLSAVILPPSLPVHRSAKTCPYDSNMAMTRLMQLVQRRLHKQPHHMNIVAKDVVSRLRKRNVEQMEWQAVEREWRKSVVDFSNSEDFAPKVYRVLITGNLPEIKAYYQAEDISKLAIIDCSSKDVEKELESRLQVAAGHNNAVKQHGASNRVELENNFCLILLNAHLLSDSHRRYAASCAVRACSLLLFVVPLFNPDDLTINVREGNQHFALQGAYWSTLSCKSFTEFSPAVVFVFRVLRLLLGSLVKIDILGSIDECLMRHDQQLLDPVLRSINEQEPSIPLQVLRECLTVILHHSPSPHRSWSNTPDTGSSLHEQLSTISCSYIRKHFDHSALPMDISFEMFIRESTVCQILPQPERIASWLASVLFEGDTSAAKEVVQLALKTAPLVHSQHLLAYMESDNHWAKDPSEDHPSVQEILSYGYVGHDSSMDKQELLFQQSLLGNELDWNTLASEWKLFPHSLDFLMKLLLVYPYNLKLLSCVSNASLFQLLENATVHRYRPIFERLNRAVQEMDAFLHTLQIPNDDDAQDFLRILKWLLLNTKEIPSGELQIDEWDISALIRHRIPLMLANENVIDRVLPIVLSLDGPDDLLYQQVGLRTFFLGQAAPAANKILAEESYPLGAVFVHFMFHPHILKLAHQEQHAFVSNERSISIMEWLIKGNIISLKLAERFTPKAYATMLARSTSTTQTDALWSAFSKSAKHTKESRNMFLTEVIEYADELTTSQSQMIRFLELVTSSTEYKALEFVKLGSGYRSLYEALEQQSFEMVQMNQQIPIEYSEKIKRLYIASFPDEKIDIAVEKEISKHCACVTSAGWEQVLLLLLDEPQAQRNFLMILAWSFHPFRALPLNYTDETQVRRFFKAIVTHPSVAFQLKVERNLHCVDNLALYLVAPHFLDQSVFSYYNSVFRFYPDLQKHYLVICQKESLHASSYSIVIPERSLPEIIIEELLSSSYPLDVWKEQKDRLNLKYDVTSGVNEELFYQNLSALCNTRLMTFRNNNAQKIEDEKTQRFVAGVILAWFWAMGISMSILEEKLAALGQMDTVVWLRQQTNMDHLVTEPTLYPVPAYIDVKMRFDTTATLFGVTKEASLYTYQTMVTMLDDSQNFTVKPQELLVPCGENQYKRSSSYKQLHRLAVEAFAVRFAGMLRNVQSHGNCYQLTDLETYSHRLFLVLRAMMLDRLSSSFCRNPIHLVTEILTVFIHTIKAQLRDMQPDRAKVLQAITTRCVASRIFVAGQATLLQILSELFSICKLEQFSCCRHTWNELLYWQHSFAIQCETLKDSALKEQLTLEIRRHDGSSTLSYEYLQLHSNLPARPPVVSSITSKGKERVVDSNHGCSASTEDLDGGARSLGPSLMDCSAVAETCLFKLGQVTTATANNGTEDIRARPNQTVLGSQTKEDDELGDGVIYCHHLLEIASYDLFSEMKLKAGLESYLVQHPYKPWLYCFMPAEIIADMLKNPVKYKNEQRVFQGKVVAYYQNNIVAWTTLSQTCPSRTLLVIDGMLLKKGSDNKTWIPTVIGYDFVLASQALSLESDLFFWHLLYTYKLLGYRMSQAMVNLLEFLCRVVFSLWKDNHPYDELVALQNDKEKHVSVVSLLNQMYSDPQRESDRQEMESLALSLMDFVAVVIAEATDTKQKTTAFVIIQEQLSKRNESNKYSSIRNFVPQLEDLVLSSTGDRGQILCVLERKYDLDVIFGANALQHTRELCLHWQKMDEDDEMMDDVIFWDEDFETIFEPDQKQPAAKSDQSSTLPQRSVAKQQRETSKDASLARFRPFGTYCGLGYGDYSLRDRNQLLALVGCNPPIFYHFVDKLTSYNAEDLCAGITIAYFLHKRLYHSLGYATSTSITESNTVEIGDVTSSIGEEKLKKIAGNKDQKQTHLYTKWLVNVLNSPLSLEHKAWFLNLCSHFYPLLPPIAASSTTTARSSSVVAHCLAQNCPIHFLRQVLLGTCLVPQTIEPFCRRKDCKYGVYFVNTHTLKRMRDLGLPLALVDLSSEIESGTVSPDHIYERMVSHFTGFTCFVFVQGLPVIDDLLLKWCCEYTEKFPWRFFFFEGTDTSFNFSENRDRCNYSFYFRHSLNEWQLGAAGHNITTYHVQFNSLQSTHAHAGDAYRDEQLSSRLLHNNREWSELFLAHFGLYAKWPKKSEALPDWERTFNELYDRDQCVLFVVGPPGAGKSFELNKKREMEQKKGAFFGMIDCSNDELVERAMEDLLNEKFPETRMDGNSILVADEFHMLSEEHKRQLFDWFIPRLNWLKVILIGNRSNEYDDRLLQSARKQTSGQATIKKIQGRLRIEKIFEVNHVKEKSEHYNFLDMWHRASRLLFSDESISLRNVDPLVQTFNRSQRSREESLAELLLSKVPTLGDYTCLQFAITILQLLKEERGRSQDMQSMGNDPLAMTPMQLLVRTALQDKRADLCSYSEFVRGLPNSHRAHPVVRLAAWLTMLHIETSKDQSVPSLDILKQLRLVDQILFPLLTGTSLSPCSLQGCNAFTRQGDYTDLDWMANSIEHGYAIDWGAVSNVWALEFVTDAQKFERLLSICPDPKACLSAITPKNLCVLIESFATTSLARRVLEHTTFINTKENEYPTSDSTYFTAAWFLLRNQSPPYSDEVLRQLNVRLLSVLLWASFYSFHFLNVVDDPKGRETFLRELLIKVTTKRLLKMLNLKAYLFGDADDSLHGNSLLTVRLKIQRMRQDIIDIWSHVFAPLLRAGLRNNGIPYEACLMLAASQYPVNSAWPLLIRHLSAVLHQRADQAIVNSLENHEIFFRLHERSAEQPDHDFILPGITRYSSASDREMEKMEGGDFVPALLSLPNSVQLSVWWQMKILTTPGIHVLNELDVQSCLSKLDKGIAVLKGAYQLKVVDGPLRDEICKLVGASSSPSESSVGDALSRHTNRLMKSQQNHEMRFLKRIINNPKILEYFNVYAGASVEEIEAESGFEVDQYKNPKGECYDLGRNGAFGAFKILVGNFHQRTAAPYTEKAFWQYAGRALQQKGFRVDYVEREDKFIAQLKDISYNACWLISSDALDWNLREPPGVDKWRRLADACEAFHHSGRGIFIFADNEPFYDHANVVLERLVGAKLKSSTPGQRDMKRNTTKAPDTLPPIGQFNQYLITSGLETLYEGCTICYPEAMGKLVSLATSFDRHPALMYYKGEERKGRIVVDTGFTKLWTEWDRAGTHRYICNATVWLLGIEERLRRNVGSVSAYGPILSLPAPGRTPRVEPEETKNEKLDVLLVVDGSGSVLDSQFDQMRLFCKEFITRLNVSQLVQVGLIQFGSRAVVEVPITSDKSMLYQQIDAMIQMKTGTYFNRALLLALQEFRAHGRVGVRKLILFQTDGVDGSQDASLAPSLHAQGIHICGVGVGTGYDIEYGLQKVVSQPYNEWIMMVSDYSKMNNIINALIAKCSAL